LKKIAFLAAILSFTSMTAQKNNSLLWEISGNGLTKKSYLYGTMHVSEKVSYHLSDAFFKHLLEADIVSNESDPETWQALSEARPDDYYDQYRNGSYKFYSLFYLRPMDKEMLKYVFSGASYSSHIMSLSNYDEESANFQENNVLDMFIYQTGRKYKKRIVGLEDARKSMELYYSVSRKDARPKEENLAIAMKIMKNRPISEAMKDFYREKDIVMLDSLSKLTSSEKSHEAMIVKRNIIMARSIDSLAHTGSVFAAVGAAHLAGKQGIIELLRAKGFTLSPVIDSLTDAGKKQKKTLEEYFPEPDLKMSHSQDHMIEIPMTKNVMDNDSSIEAPDYTNGGVLNILRLPLNYFLKKQDETLNPKALDSLFYEGIAGNILEKKYFEQENYSGYDIRNITKTGNTQHSRFYITPLELIVVSMNGKGDYVKQYENRVFDNIKIKPFKKEWETVAPKRGGFSAEMPAFTTIFGLNPEKSENISVQAYDPSEKAYYFLTEKTSDDIAVLEDPDYEHRQIHYEFYLQRSIDTTDTHFNSAHNAYESASMLGSKKIKLKSIIKGNKYYLLGTVNASDNNSARFFNSFTTTAYNYSAAVKVFKDTVANFSITIPEKQNKGWFLKLPRRNRDAKNIFGNDYNYYSFMSETGQTLTLNYYKYGKYETAKSLDTIRKNYRQAWLRDYEKSDSEKNTVTEYGYDGYDYGGEDRVGISMNNPSLSSKKGFSASQWDKIMSSEDEKFEFISQSETYDKEKNCHIFDAVVSTPKAVQAIRYKAYVYNDRTYTFSALIDKNTKENDAFIENTIKSFEPKTIADISVSDNKIMDFINDANSEKDTIRFSALSSIHMLELTKKDFPTVRNFLETFNFKENENEKTARQSLLEKIAQIESAEVIEFLDTFYKKENVKTADQITILEALATHKNEAAYKKILELMEYDLPLPEDASTVSFLFSMFKDDPENSRQLFPGIFSFYGVPEYNEPILDFCSFLLDKDLISAKKIKQYRKTLVTNAKLECKRMASWKQNNVKPIQAEEDEDEEMAVETWAGEMNAPAKTLLSYLELIYSLPQDNSTISLIQKIRALDIPELNVELLRLGVIKGKATDEELTLALQNPKYAYVATTLLINQNKKHLLKALSDDQIAESVLFNLQQLTEKDTIEQIDKRVIDHNGKPVTFYFFKYPSKQTYRNTDKKDICGIAFINEGDTINPLAYKVFEMNNNEEEEEETDIEEKILAVINTSLYEKHIRASFEKEKDVMSYGGYDDY
jgi:uncharacterized protein YbaP (TraB family)